MGRFARGWLQALLILGVLQLLFGLLARDTRIAFLGLLTTLGAAVGLGYLVPSSWRGRPQSAGWATFDSVSRLVIIPTMMIVFALLIAFRDDGTKWQRVLGVVPLAGAGLAVLARRLWRGA